MANSGPTLGGGGPGGSIGVRCSQILEIGDHFFKGHLIQCTDGPPRGCTSQMHYSS